MTARRRRRAASAVLAAILILGASLTRLGAQSAAPSAAPPDDVPVSTVTLDNGLRVIVVEDHAAPVVSVGMWYRFGAGDERGGKIGLAHALAHAMYDGTPYFSSAALDDVITRFGAKASATTGNDYTTYRFVVPADELELTLRIEADRMQHLVLADAAWQREKRALLAEREFDLTGPLAHLYHDVCVAASTAPVCALSPLGDASTIAGASAEDLRSYYQDWYTPDNATLVISGDVASDAALSLARAVFGGIPRGNPPPRSTVRPQYASGKQVEVAGDFPYEVVDLAFEAPGTQDPGGAAFPIIDAIVNNPLSDFSKALVRSGYTYGYSTQLDQNVHGGLYHVFLIAAPGHTSAQARDAFVDVMQTAQATGFPDDLVRAAKLTLARKNTFARDSIAALGERIGTLATAQGVTTFAAADARTEAVTARDLQNLAERYFAEPVVTGLLQPSAAQSARNPGPPATSVTDDFARRAPTGPVVEAPLLRRLSTQPMTLRSRLQPQEFTLPNGVRVLVQRAPDSPTVFIQGTVETSNAFDAPGKDGEGAMFSSLLDSGSKTTDFDARHRTLDELGATMNLGLTFDAHGRAADFERLTGLIADALEHPGLRAADIETVRKETLDAVTQRDRDPDARAEEDFDRLLYAPGDPILREPTAASIASITAADLRAYASRFVRPDLTVLTVVGDVDPASVRAAMLTAFGDWRATGPRPNLDPGPIPPVHPGLRYVVDGDAYAQAHLGTRGVAHGSPDFPALDVLSEILGAGGGFDTRLVDDLRTRRGLAYRASTTLAVDRYRGTFEFHIAADPKKIAAAVAELRAQLSRLQVDPVGPAELDRARTKIVAGGFVSEESTQEVTARVQKIGLDHLPLDEESTLPQRYAALDGAKLLAAAAAYLRPDTLIDVYEGPQP